MTLSAMVVDDDELVRRVLRRQMSTLGASPVAVAGDGSEAEQVMREQGPFDVILLDLMMPGVDGIEFLRSLAKTHQTSDLILTSSLDPKLLRTAESLAQAHSLKVLGVLQKPIRPSALGELLARRNPLLAQRFDASPVTVERLTDALRAGQVVPQFQPKVCARTGRVKSVEALARWRDPREGNISPARFIPVAERHGLIDEFTMRQAEQALRVLGRWSAQGFHPDLELNVSAVSLERVEMPDQMARLAIEHDVDPSRITFEITESALIGHLSQSLDTLTRLRMKGFHLAVDDFGTGYATLSQLKMLPLSELKIDHSFVTRALRDPEARAIVDSCVALAQQFGLVSVAEGVEDADTAQLLRGMGATLLQGFLYSPALPESQLLQWSRAHATH